MSTKGKSVTSNFPNPKVSPVEELGQHGCSHLPIYLSEMSHTRSTCDFERSLLLFIIEVQELRTLAMIAQWNKGSSRSS